ncbi:hypothetical protein KUV74_03040 [Halomonas sp. DP1Y21-3]|uniref:hypothetical protein n=1 Tax=unclassified Halomonas TaxID=2609666 RepID=UPI001C956CDA|nr:hypothetical protein [Halomonas sp. DP1Y21-3]MBY6109370.1 hypothetical protein [Halomonas sp. DP1Y21-3]
MCWTNNNYNRFITFALLLSFASIAFSGEESLVNENSLYNDPDLCIVDKSGQRNGLWHTCYSVLRSRVAPEETIVCDTGMLRGEGYCRVLPKEICTLVEGAARSGDLPCWVNEDLNDPERGVIGWRPVRSLEAQEPVLKLVDFILMSAVRVGKDRVVHRLSQTMEKLEQADFEMGRLDMDYASDRVCNAGKHLTFYMQLVEESSITREMVGSVNAISPDPHMDPYEHYCVSAILCTSLSRSTSPVIDGLADSYFVINQLQCQDEIGVSEKLHLSEDIVERARAEASFGPAEVAATRIIFAGDSMSDTELLQARDAIHAYLLPEFQDQPAIFDYSRFEALTKAPSLQETGGVMLELVILDRLARLRGTELPEIAAMLFRE